MTLPTREEAQHEWTRFDNVDNGYGVSARILAAYADGVLLTREEWLATFPNATLLVERINGQYIATRWDAAVREDNDE